MSCRISDVFQDVGAKVQWFLNEGWNQVIIFPSKIDLTNESLGKLLARAIRYSGFFSGSVQWGKNLRWRCFWGNMSISFWKLETPPNLTRPVWWFKTWFRSSPLLKGRCCRFPPRWHHFVLEDMGGSFMKLSLKKHTPSLPKNERVMSPF